MRNLKKELANVTTKGGNSGIPYPKKGGYVVKVLNVVDHPEKEVLWLYVDIAEGESKGYYKENNKKPILFVNYDEKSLANFKTFTEIIEEGNKGYKWNYDEKTLVDKKFGCLTRQEEYLKDDGTIGSSMKFKYPRSIKTIVDGNYKDLPPKLISGGNRTANNDVPNTVVEDEDEIPF